MRPSQISFLDACAARVNQCLAPPTSPSRRCLQSPGSCQGAAALDEVCPPAAAAASAAEPSRFELVAGEEGIAEGQEVTISYGSWPSDVFLLFFGFAPHDNPHDSGALLWAR